MWRELGFTGIETRELPGRVALGVLIPQLLFYAGLQQATLTVALVAAGGWTVGLQLYDLARRRSVDPFLLYGIVFTVLQAAAALYARNPWIYAGGGVVENLLEGLVLLGSAVVCRPLLVSVVNAALRGQAQAVVTLPMRAGLERLTALWALALLGRSVGLYAALAHLPMGQFLLVNTLAGWPLNGVGVFLSLVYLRAQLRSGTTPRHGRCLRWALVGMSR